MRNLIKVAAAVLAATVLLVAPTVGQEPTTYRVRAPGCIDGGSQYMSGPIGTTGTLTQVRAWIKKQQKGGPDDVRDGICENWTNVWQIEYREPLPDEEGNPVWSYFKSSDGCR